MIKTIHNTDSFKSIDISEAKSFDFIWGSKHITVFMIPLNGMLQNGVYTKLWN